jgi:hypothetical protein
MKRLALTALAATVLSVALGAQGPPPINPTIVPEGSSNTFYRGAHAVVVAVVDGIEHAYQFTRDLIVPGRHGGDSLADLREGTTVAVQDQARASSVAPDDVDANGNGRAAATEGTVTKIDRRHAQITVRFAEGKDGTFQLVDAHPKAAAAADAEKTVMISYAGRDGNRVMRVFSALSGS